VRRPLLPIFLIVLVDVLGLTIILPLLPFYAERLGATPFQAGLLTSVYAACQLVSGPLLGRLSDQTGRKPLLLLSQAGTLLGFLVLARAEALWVVFVSRVIDGATAGNLSLAQAYIADVTAPKDRAKSFALIGIAFGLGFLVGPALSGVLAQYGYQYPVYMAAGLSLTSILCTAFLLPATVPHAEAPAPDGPPPPSGRRLSVLDWSSYAAYFKRPDLARLLWQFFCFCFAFAAFTSGFGLFAERRLTWEGHAFGAREVGLTFAFSGFLGIILQGGLIGRLVRRFGERALVTSGFVAAAAGYAILSRTFAVPALLVAATVSAFGNGVLRPSLTSLITQHVPRSEAGAVLGLTQSLLSVAQITAPALGGLLITHGLLTTWGLGAAAVVAGALLLAPPAAAARAAGP
jgi:DHA1 family tetracycline resistance protein-like MFS transporter